MLPRDIINFVFYKIFSARKDGLPAERLVSKRAPLVELHLPYKPMVALGDLDRSI